MSWAERAACRGMDSDLFFPTHGDHAALQAAKAVCATCPVTAECRAYADRIEENDGVFGGASGRQRSRERRARLVRDREIVCRECGATFLGTPQSRICSDHCRQVRERRRLANRTAVA
jgi:WhiB family redox-sensing transcriptional regulator